MLHTLTYISSTTELLTVPELVELLEASRPKNDGLGLTGMLLYSGGNVIQTIEGPEEAVEAMFAVIAVDPRHTDVRVLRREAIAERAYPEWSMGFRNLGEREVRDVPDRLLELLRANTR